MPVHVRAAPVAVGGRPGDRGAGRGRSPSTAPARARATARSPASAGASATAPRPRARPRATPTSARASTARCCGSRTTPAIPATSAWRPGSSPSTSRRSPRPARRATAATGEPVTLGGGASYDVDGTVTAHRWDMGDGTAARRRDRHPRLSPRRGDYVATLTVTRRFGRRQRRRPATRVAITVNAPPVPVRDRPRPPDRGRRDRPARRPRLDRRGRRDPVLVLGLRRRRQGRGAGGAVRLGGARGLSGDADRHRRLRDRLGGFRDDDRRHGQRRAGRRRRARPVGRGQRGRLRRRRVAATPTAAITSYEWSFGDGATASGRSVRHAYARLRHLRGGAGGARRQRRAAQRRPRHRERARQQRADRRRRPRPRRRARRGGGARRLRLGRSRRRRSPTGSGASPTAARHRARGSRKTFAEPRPACGCS